VAVATFRRGIAIAVTVGGGLLAISIAATIDNWHPDYRAILVAAGALSVLSSAWAVLMLTRGTPGE
jgi:hypothetical protein